MHANGRIGSQVRPEETDVIQRDLNRTYPVIDRGEGIYLFDKDGKRYVVLKSQE